MGSLLQKLVRSAGRPLGRMAPIGVDLGTDAIRAVQLEPVSEPGHAHAAEFAGDIGAGGHRRDAIPPSRYHLVVLVGIDADPADTADVVENDWQVRHGLGEVRDLRQLGEGLHDVQDQSLLT